MDGWEALREIDNILVEEESEIVIENSHEFTDSQNFDYSSEDSVLEVELIDKNEDEDEIDSLTNEDTSLFQSSVISIEPTVFNSSNYSTVPHTSRIDSTDCNSTNPDIMSNIPKDESVPAVTEYVENIEDNEAKNAESEDKIENSEYDTNGLSDHSLYTQSSNSSNFEKQPWPCTNIKTTDEENKIRDKYCWMCHKDGESFEQCNTCPRVFHYRCLSGQRRNDSFHCLECIAVLKANNLSSKSAINLEQLSLSLIFIIARLKSHEDSDLFWNPVDVEEFPQYKNYVVYPMDFSIVENKVTKRLYGSTEAFLADVKWIVHNCIVFNTSSSQITTIAKTLFKICKKELSEMNTCAECYYRSLINADTWFLEACKKPHMLLWAKLKGFPPWPAKAMKYKDGMVDVRFFGVHDRSWVCLKDCYLYSATIPQASKIRRGDLEISVNEVEKHIEKLKEKYGEFVYAPNKIQYDPVNELEQLQLMLPTYKPEDVDDIFLVEDNISKNFQIESPVRNSTPEKKLQKGKKSPRGSKKNSTENKEKVEKNEKLEEISLNIVKPMKIIKRSKKILPENIENGKDEEKKEEFSVENEEQKKIRGRSKKIGSQNTEKEEQYGENEEADVEISKGANQEESSEINRKIASNCIERGEREEIHEAMEDCNGREKENKPNEETQEEFLEHNEREEGSEKVEDIHEENLEYDEREKENERNEDIPEYNEREDVYEEETYGEIPEYYDREIFEHYRKEEESRKDEDRSIENEKKLLENIKEDRNELKDEILEEIIEKKKSPRCKSIIPQNNKIEKESSKKKKEILMKIIENPPEEYLQEEIILRKNDDNRMEIIEPQKKYEEILYSSTGNRTLPKYKQSETDDTISRNCVSKPPTKRTSKSENKGPLKKFKLNEPVKLSENVTISLIEEEIPVQPVPCNTYDSTDIEMDNSMENFKNQEISPKIKELVNKPTEIKLPKFNIELIEKIERVFEETVPDMAKDGDPYCEVLMLRKRLEDQKAHYALKFEKMVEECQEIKNQFERKIIEVRNTSISRRRHELALARVKFLQEKKDAVNEAKCRQWCACCRQLARFYCCWNTSYCGLECQKMHWNIHASNCWNGLNRKGKQEFSTTCNEMPNLVPFNVNFAMNVKKSMGNLKKISQDTSLIVDVETCDDH